MTNTVRNGDIAVFSRYDAGICGARISCFTVGDQMLYKTSCHCGAVTIDMHRRIRKLTRCNCSICRRYGALWAYQQRKAVAVADDSGAVAAYCWGKGKLTFFHCSVCGCVTHYERSGRRVDGSDMCAVNMRNIIDPKQISEIPVRLIDGAKSWKVLSEVVEPYLLTSPGLGE